MTSYKNCYPPEPDPLADLLSTWHRINLEKSTMLTAYPWFNELQKGARPDKSRALVVSYDPDLARPFTYYTFERREGLYKWRVSTGSGLPLPYKQGLEICQRLAAQKQLDREDRLELDIAARHYLGEPYKPIKPKEQAYIPVEQPKAAPPVREQPSRFAGITITL